MTVEGQLFPGVKGETRKHVTENPENVVETAPISGHWPKAKLPVHRNNNENADDKKSQ
jgi:hypothetical protein